MEGGGWRVEDGGWGIGDWGFVSKQRAESPLKGALDEKRPINGSGLRAAKLPDCLRVPSRGALNEKRPINGPGPLRQIFSASVIMRIEPWKSNLDTY
jgi:hypothetical protein